jgi:hypothetical protein
VQAASLPLQAHQAMKTVDVAALAAQLGPQWPPGERVRAAAELAGAAAAFGANVRQRIATAPGALSCLVAMVSDRGQPQAQVHAAALVRQLAKGDGGAQAGGAPGMLPALVALLQPQGSEPEAQLHATWALCNLCTGASKSAASICIAQTKGAIAALRVPAAHGSSNAARGHARELLRAASGFAEEEDKRPSSCCCCC